MEVFTIGHSNHTPERFLELLHQHKITMLVDVRSKPQSRFPHFQRDNLILFEGGRYSMDGFKQRLGEVVAAQGPTRLLLRVDKQTSAQALVTFTAVATGAGCDVQIAAEAAAAGAN